MPLSASSQNPSNAGVPELESPTIEIPLRLPAAHLSFPVLSETKRLKLISNLQSWTFNAMGYSSEELLGCVGLIFESVRNMEGVEFDLGQCFVLDRAALTCPRSIQVSPHLRTVRLPRPERLPQLLARDRRDSSAIFVPGAHGTRAAAVPLGRG